MLIITTLASTIILLLTTVLVNSTGFMELDASGDWHSFLKRGDLIANIGTVMGTMFFISFAILLLVTL